MAWLFLEVLVALLLLIGIVWWTLPAKKDEKERHGKANDEGRLPPP